MSRDNEISFDTFMKPKAHTPVPYYALGVVVAAFKESQHTIKELKQRVSELENTSLKDCGVWKPDRAYGKGSVVTLKGSQ